MEQDHREKRKDVHMHGAQINFGDLTPYVTYSGPLILYVQYTYVYKLYNIGATNTNNVKRFCT